MLFYYNSKIIFDFEIQSDNHYIGTHSFFCEDNATSNFIPNLKIEETIKTSDLRKSDKAFALSINEHVALLTFWYNTSKFRKLYDWSIQDWIISYINDMKNMYTVLHGDINDGISIFQDRRDYMIKNLSLNINNEEDCNHIIFDIPMKPEYSWAVEDCLYHRLAKTKSKYRAYVNKIINKNIHHRNYYERRKSLFYDTPFIKKKGLDIMTMDLSNKEILSYLYSPYPNESLRTSLTHLKQVVQYFLERN